MRVVKKTVTSNIDIDRLSAEVGLAKTTTTVLVSRGIDTKDAIERFVYDKNNDYYDPFLLKNMSSVIDRIRAAADNKETVIVYGDYDCDGVCSSAILQGVLSSKGINTIVHIPRRNTDGYGLNIAIIEELVEAHNPDLIITCDCGISAINEVAHTLDLGIDIIITDHHEPADTLPSCLVVNPKQEGCLYPDKNLCGAGVAFKVAQALCGLDMAEQYIDIASVATIADMVIMLDENRTIVKRGLRRINSKECNKGLKRLIDNIKLQNLTSQDIAFKISPRINVAGRMGDAYNAYILLTSNNTAEIDSMIDIICKDNDKRRIMCDSQYNEARAYLRTYDIGKARSIVLINKEWEKGLTGILAARLTNDFCRPSFVLTGKKDNILKGTARSIERVNLYEMLGFAKDLLIEFGGHKQAAGFSIKDSNVDAFKERIETYLRGLDDSVFLQEISYDCDINACDITEELIAGLEVLEPYGVGFERPLFCVETSNIKAENVKNTHTALTVDDTLSVMSFFNTDDLKWTECDKCRLVVDLQLNVYNNKVTPKGILKADERYSLVFDDSIACASNIYASTYIVPKKPIYQSVQISELASLVDSMYGVLIVCSGLSEYRLVHDMKLRHIVEECFLYQTGSNNFSKLFVSPDYDALDLGYYDKIIFVSMPLHKGLIARLNSVTNANIMVADGKASSIDMDMSRDGFLNIYNILKEGSEDNAKNIFEHLRQLARRNSGISIDTMILAFRVFEELGLITRKSNYVGFGYVVNAVKTELVKSNIYNEFLKLNI